MFFHRIVQNSYHHPTGTTNCKRQEEKTGQSPQFVLLSPTEHIVLLLTPTRVYYPCQPPAISLFCFFFVIVPKFLHLIMLIISHHLPCQVVVNNQWQLRSPCCVKMGCDERNVTIPCFKTICLNPVWLILLFLAHGGKFSTKFPLINRCEVQGD